MQDSFFSKYKRPIFFVLMFCAIALFYYFVRSYITVESLQKDGQYLFAFIERHQVVSVIVYILFFAAVIAASLPMVGPLAIAGGYLFGMIPGFCYGLLATTLGGLSAFLALRYFMSGEALEKKRKKFAKMERKIKENGISYLLMLQLLSVVPFFVINTVAILANASVFTLVWTTIVGSAPGLLLYTFAGKQLRMIGSFGDIFSPGVIVALLLLIVVIFVVPKLLKKFKKGFIK